LAVGQLHVAVSRVIIIDFYQIFSQFVQGASLAFVIRVFLDMADIPAAFLFVEQLEFYNLFLSPLFIEMIL